jgi:hypothetical protein
MAKRKKTPVRMQVTGRTIAYEQQIGRGGKLGKAKPVLITTTRVLGAGAPQAATKKRRRRRS